MGPRPAAASQAALAAFVESRYEAKALRVQSLLCISLFQSPIQSGRF